MEADNHPYQAPSASVDPTNDDADPVLVAYLGDRNADYYIKVFRKFETGGGLLSWNWAAFFATSPWLLYRRLWIWFFVFWLGLPFVAITAGTISSVIHPLFGLAVFLFMYFCLAPIFGNYIFYRKATEELAAARAVSSRIETQIAAADRSGETNEMGAWVFGIIVYSIFTANMIFTVIPAFQNPDRPLVNIAPRNTASKEARDQVESAVGASLDARQLVELYYLENKQYPLDSAVVGYRFEQGGNPHIESIHVHEGRVVIEFSDESDSHLRDEQLFMIPRYTGAGFAWSCGSASIEMDYLPRRCRL